MRILSAKDAKYGFGRLIDLVRGEPVTVVRHGRPVVVVMSVEEFERLQEIETGHVDSHPSIKGTVSDHIRTNSDNRIISCLRGTEDALGPFLDFMPGSRPHPIDAHSMDAHSMDAKTQ